MEFLTGPYLFCILVIFILAALTWFFAVPGYFKKCADELESISSSLRALVEVERDRLRLERDKYNKDKTRSGL